MAIKAKTSASAAPVDEAAASAECGDTLEMMSVEMRGCSPTRWWPSWEAVKVVHLPGTHALPLERAQELAETIDSR